MLWSGGEGETDSQAGIMTLFVCQQGRGFSTNRLSTLWRTALLLAIHLASRPVYNVERASRSALPSFWCLWIGKRAKTGRRTAPVYSNNGCPQSVAAWTHNKSDSIKNKYVSNASHLFFVFFPTSGLLKMVGHSELEGFFFFLPGTGSCTSTL